MLYFILWVIFMLVVMLSLPIVMYLEKRKYQAAHPVAGTAPPEGSGADGSGADGSGADGGVEDAFGNDPADPFAGSGSSDPADPFGNPTGDEAFSSFDEID
jgi:hypothetical protein